MSPDHPRKRSPSESPAGWRWLLDADMPAWLKFLAGATVVMALIGILAVLRAKRSESRRDRNTITIPNPKTVERVTASMDEMRAIKVAASRVTKEGGTYELHLTPDRGPFRAALSQTTLRAMQAIKTRLEDPSAKSWGGSIVLRLKTTWDVPDHRQSAEESALAITNVANKQALRTAGGQPVVVNVRFDQR